MRLQNAALIILLLANVLSSPQFMRRRDWLGELSVISLSMKTANAAIATTSFSFSQMFPHDAAAGAVHDNSSWIGNQWIPPRGFRMYAIQEIQRFFLSSSSPSDAAILFIGDSNARQMYGSFFAILNATATTHHHNTHYNNIDTWDMDAPHIVDVNKKAVTEVCATKNVSICRSLARWSHNSNEVVPVHDLSVDYEPLSCAEQIVVMDWERLAQEYSVIVIHIGAWHLKRRCRSEDLIDFEALITKLAAIQRHNLTIVWVTMGSVALNSYFPARRTWKEGIAANYQLRQQVEHQQQNVSNFSPRRHSLTVLDWGSVMSPRSWPSEDRIHGNMVAHYGLEARLVQIQMLMNHLLHRESIAQAKDLEI